MTVKDASSFSSSREHYTFISLDRAKKEDKIRRRGSFLDTEVRMKRIEDIISSRKVFLLFCFYFLLVLFFGKIQSKKFHSLSDKKLTWESRVLRKKHLSHGREKNQDALVSANNLILTLIIHPRRV